MTIDIKEKQFENHIETSLIMSGYKKRNSEDFDYNIPLDSKLFVQFLKETQPKKWEKLLGIFDTGTEEELVRKLSSAIQESSLINVIRNGFSIYDVHLDCAYFKPVSSLNPESEILYQKNILSVIRQAHYNSENQSVDLLLCLNGLSFATGEIKNPATGQDYKDAIRQYEEDRDPREPLFRFKTGALVHFAIDPHEIHMTTRLNGDKTEFLPFNKGKDEGKGNPENPNGYETSYLWEDILQKDTILEIIGNFVDLQIIDQKPPIPHKEILIFPRYHQLDAVVKLISATKKNGTGTNYLIHHSTGSGKSNTIAWLAYKLFSLHNNEDKPIFDGILVLSDRIGIVNQLGNTIKQFEHTPGIVKSVESSSDLAENLEAYRKILISTQQKFPFVLEKISKVKGKYFAIIIDEAHSSQTGDSATKVKEVLTTNLDEAARIESEEEERREDIVDQIEKEMDKRGPHKNLSYYAFTATPKKKTLRIFGTQVSPEDYLPFHLYSMKQAIEEGFILNVLKNYTTYESYFKIVKTASEEKVVEGKKASRALLRYVDSHHLSRSNKAKVIVEHFRTHTQNKIGGKAKAMLVASSRSQALKYKQEIDEYISKKNYSGIGTLVAFSGSLKDDLGNVYTEQNINKTKTEEEFREKFDQPEYRILIVAEKYQTGYDQPLLHTMYVDKSLHGIKAVQTLSRPNRIHTGKTETFVVDFQNKVEDIHSAFLPYYKGTTLVDKTTPEYLFKLYQQIMDFKIITEFDLDKFAQTFYKPLSQQTDADLGKLYAAVSPILTRFGDANEKDQDQLKAKIVRYIEAYSFLTLVIPYDDTNLEKLYTVLKFLANENLIRDIGTQIPDLRGDVSLQWYRLEKTHEGDILLGKKTVPITMGEDYGASTPPEILTSLSEVIRTINERFGGDFSDADTISLENWLVVLKNDSFLRQVAKNNDFQDFLKQFEKRFLDLIISPDEQNQSLVTRIYSHIEFQKQLIVAAAQMFHQWAKANNLPPITPSNPAQNRLLFKQTIHQCKGHVHWLDLYLNLEALEFLIDNFDRSKVEEIKLLTGLYDNEYSINEKLAERFKAYQEELRQNGISLEFRIVTTKEAREKVAHDRYLLGESVKFNVPSFTMVVKGRFSEIKRTENEIPFNNYWNDKDSLDLLKDWDKIKQNQMHEYTCGDCKAKFKVPFRIPSGRTPYCQKCFPKHRS